MEEAKATPVVEAPVVDVNKVVYGIGSNSEYEVKPTEICYALFVQRKPEEIPEEVPEGIPVEPIAEKIIVTRTHEEVKAKEVPNVYFNGINNPVDYEKKYNDSIITIKDLSTKLEIFNDKLVNANKQYANLVVINKKQAELIKKLSGNNSESVMDLESKYNSLIEENTSLKDQVKDLESKYAIAMIDIEKAEKQLEQEEELYKRRLLDQKANIRRDLDKRIEELTKENAALKQANISAATPAKTENNFYQVATFDFPIYMRNMVFKPAGSFDIDICDEYYDELVNLIKSIIKDKTDIVVDINDNEDLKTLIKRKIHTYGNDYRMMPLMMAFTNCELDENLRKLAFGVIAYINGK